MRQDPVDYISEHILGILADIPFVGAPYIVTVLRDWEESDIYRALNRLVESGDIKVERNGFHLPTTPCS